MKTNRRKKQIRKVNGFRRVVRLVPITKKIVTAGPVYEAFGEALRDARTAAGMRQEDLGVKVGLSRTSIVNIEQARQRIYLDDLLIFAKAVGVEPRKFFDAISDRPAG